MRQDVNIKNDYLFSLKSQMVLTWNVLRGIVA